MNEKITLVKDTIDIDDVNNLIEWLKTNPRLTKGDLTIEFEKKWSEWLGTKYSVFVKLLSSSPIISQILFHCLINLCRSAPIVPLFSVGS